MKKSIYTKFDKNLFRYLGYTHSNNGDGFIKLTEKGKIVTSPHAFSDTVEHWEFIKEVNARQFKTLDFRIFGARPVLTKEGVHLNENLITLAEFRQLEDTVLVPEFEEVKIYTNYSKEFLEYLKTLNFPIRLSINSGNRHIFFRLNVKYSDNAWGVASPLWAPIPAGYEELSHADFLKAVTNLKKKKQILKIGGAVCQVGENIKFGSFTASFEEFAKLQKEVNSFYKNSLDKS